MASLSTPETVPVDAPYSANPECLPAAIKRTSFDAVSIAFHWLTVILVLGLITTAAWHALSHDDVLRVLLLRIHRSLGVTVWFTTVRYVMVWRATWFGSPGIDAPG